MPGHISLRVAVSGSVAPDSGLGGSGGSFLGGRNGVGLSTPPPEAMPTAQWIAC
jgi:hypothetical protein